MKTSLFLIGAALLTINIGAQAQNRGNGRGNQGNQNNGGGQNGGTFPLPEGVEQLVSIDAYNILLAQTDRDGKKDLSPIIVKHIYSGGIARLFGGTTVPTELFVSPGAFGGGNNGGNGGGRGTGVGNGGLGGQNGGLGGGFGGVQTGGGGFTGGGFTGGGFNGGQTGGGFTGGQNGAFLMRPSTPTISRFSAFRGRN